jgi:hypothetical protein
MQARPASREMARQRRWRLDGRLRKTVLLLHIVAGGTWFGLDVAMTVLVFTAIGTDSAAVRAYTLQSLELITVWPMFSVAMLSLITGIQLGLGSKYGLVRYWWVAIKLGLNLVLATLIVTSLRGEVAEGADLGRRLALGANLDWDFTDMLYPPIVSPTALAVPLCSRCSSLGGGSDGAAGGQVDVGFACRTESIVLVMTAAASAESRRPASISSAAACKMAWKVAISQSADRSERKAPERWPSVIKFRTRSSSPPACAWRTVVAGSALSAAIITLPDRRVTCQLALTRRSKAATGSPERSTSFSAVLAASSTRRTTASTRTWRDAKCP